MNAIGNSVRPRTLPPRGLLLSLLAQLPLILAKWPLQPGRVEILTGACLIAAGLALNIWADRIFRAGRVSVRPFSPALVLLSRGPYRYTRNPMYLGLVAITLGAALATGALANILIAAAFTVWLHRAYVLPEEHWLRNRFGRAFDQYANRVPRWLIR